MEDKILRTDEELAAAFRGGDKAAGEQLLIRYKNKVLSVARGFFLVGGDTEDLVQEGMCGLYSAIVSFEGNVGFSAYAYACIRNRIVDAVKKSNAGRSVAANAVTPFSEDGEGMAALDFNPEEALIDSEAMSEFSSAMKNALSTLEYRVIAMYIDGASMTEISSALGITYKQTDNALVRAKNKLRKMIGR